MQKKRNIVRQDFLRLFVSEGHISYAQAAKVYDAMIRAFADGVVTGQRINVGNVLSICPKRKPPRAINMGFRGEKKKIYLGHRLVFTVHIFKKFLDAHALNWGI